MDGDSNEILRIVNGEVKDITSPELVELYKTYFAEDSNEEDEDE